MKRCVTLGLALLGLATTACSGHGELGHGNFHYVCTSEHDFACDRLFSPNLDDGPVAVGATFDIDFLRSASDPAVNTERFAGVHPASPEVAERISDAAQSGMRFLVRGEGAFIARAADDSVMDFVHVFAEEVVDVELSENAIALDDMGMAVGSSRTITAYPLGPGGENLIGTMLCTWTSGDEAVLETPSGDQSCEITVDAVASGTTTLQVEMNDAVSREITVDVGGAP